MTLIVFAASSTWVQSALVVVWTMAGSTGLAAGTVLSPGNSSTTRRFAKSNVTPANTIRDLSDSSRLEEKSYLVLVCTM